jgi:hypothetical protein
MLLKPNQNYHDKWEGRPISMDAVLLHANGRQIYFALVDRTICAVRPARQGVPKREDDSATIVGDMSKR